MLKRKNIDLLFIIILTIFLFDVFKLTPLSRLVTYLLFGISTFGHILFFRKKKWFPKKIKTWYYFGLIAMSVSSPVGLS